MDPKSIQDLSSTGNHQDCLQSCQKLISREPENSSAWKFAGKSLLALGNFEKAHKYFIKAHQLDNSDLDTINDIGRIFLNIGNGEKASQWYNKALKINDNFAPALNELGTLKRQDGKIKEAVDLYKRAIKADPLLIQAYAGAATSLLILEDLDQAEFIAKQALRINQVAQGFNEVLGTISQKKDRTEKAVEYYQKELKINPKAINSLLNCGLILLRSGKIIESIESLEKASALNQSDQCSILLAEAYQSLGQFRKAINEYERLDINKFQDKNISFNLGLCHLYIGNNLDAVKAFKIAVRLDKTFLAAWGNIGFALMNERRHEEALHATLKVLEIDPDNADALSNLGSIYNELGNLDQALSSTLKSLKLKPHNPDALSNLGSIYKDLGNLDQALSSTLKSLELNPDNSTAQMNLGSIYKDLGNLDQALSSTLKSLKLKNDNPGALMNLGNIYRELGILDKALASTLRSLEIKPDSSDAHYLLAKIYKSLSKQVDACHETAKSLMLRSENSKTTANKVLVTNALGRKLVEQNFVPTFFDNQVINSLTNNRDDHIDYAKVYEELHSSKLNRYPSYDERISRTKTISHKEEFHSALSQGTHSLIRWKEHELFKSSNDLVIYWMIFQEVKPEVIIELGSGAGGSAIWMSDICKSLGFDTEIYSYDIESPKFKQPGVIFTEFDLMSLKHQNNTLPLKQNFYGKKKIVIEDAHVNLQNVLGEIDTIMNRDDYLIIEDSGMKQKQISDFIATARNTYVIDQFYLDFFGVNTSCCIDSIFKVF